MTGGQRARLFKIGGIFAFAFFLFYLFSSRDGGSVREMVHGKTDSPTTESARLTVLTVGHKSGVTSQTAGPTSTEEIPFNQLRTNRCPEISLERQTLDPVRLDGRRR